MTRLTITFHNETSVHEIKTPSKVIIESIMEAYKNNYLITFEDKEGVFVFLNPKLSPMIRVEG